jgi:hypothetical protein
MKHQMLDALQPFLSFLHGFDKKKSQYASFDARFKVQKHAIHN